MIEQLIILLTGVPAVFLSQSVWPEQRRWACIFGAAGQPAWFYYAWGDWPVVGISALYALSWGRGLWTHWIQPWSRARRTRAYWGPAGEALGAYPRKDSRP